MFHKYNTKLIKTRHSYTPEEIASLFGIDKKTCFRWLDEELKVMQENTKPLLIMGFELKRFLQDKQKKKQIKLKSNEFYCLRCHKGVTAKKGSEKTIKTGKKVGRENKDQLNRIGICDECGAKINRFVRIG